MTHQIELHYVARTFTDEAAVQFIILRETGNTVVEFPYSVLAEICRPESDRRDDMLRAFRDGVPVLLQTCVNKIAELEPGTVMTVTPDMLRTRVDAAA